MDSATCISMDSAKSFKGYGKVDPAADQEFHRKARRRLVILVISVIILVALVIGALVEIVVYKHNNTSSLHNNKIPRAELSPSASLKAVCSVTQYPISCYNSMSSFNKTDPEEIFKLSLHVAIVQLQKMLKHVTELTNMTHNKRVKAALGVCVTVFDDAVDRLNETISSIKVDKRDAKVIQSFNINDIKTWLSTSLTDQETCLDALHEMNSATKVLVNIKNSMKTSTEFTSNSLAIAAKILGLLAKFKTPTRRKMLGFPGWLNAGDRRMLQEAIPVPNATVAGDGTGDYKTINDAIAMIPKESVERFILYVKAGEYKENVELDKKMWNVMMYGDGKDKTIVSGSLNGADDISTFLTPTVAVTGRGFIAKDMKFINTAGPEKMQAVALRSGSDRSVFYRCAFDGYQDTLYTHSNRQFYRECDITGTVDFIFGNAAVVFQKCNIQPRKPLPNQQNTITAQSKNDPNQNTGITIQKCTITSLDSFTVPTFLGRPWRNYSTTIVMESNIDGFLDPKGWTRWFPNLDPPSTIFYAEYKNTGFGADVSQRVTWVGYKPSLTEVEASKYTVGAFIGNDWLAESQVPF